MQTTDQPFSKPNEYPDLDFTPSYPWAGVLNTPNQPAHHAESIEEFERSSRSREVRHDLWDVGLEETDSLGEPVVNDDGRLDDDSSVADDNQLLEESNSSSYEAQPEAESEVISEDSHGGSSTGDDDGVRGGKIRGSCSARGRKGIKRGLRKPLEPSLEFKALHSDATIAFIAHDYEEAEQLALQAILCNPEMFPAHSLLSEIHMARGDKTKALAALFNGAHTRPRDIQVWLKLAQWILERAGDDKLPATRDAIYCYSRVLAVDKGCTVARHKRAAMYRDSGHMSKAAYDYEYLLKQSPQNTTVLHHLAEVYIDLGQADRALSHYDCIFNHYRLKEPGRLDTVTWSDINIYCELYGFEHNYEKGISQIKSLSRWFLGRGNDMLWESFVEDDREWDSKDQPRRVQARGFAPGQYQLSSYGNGLPLELRVKLGVYRLKLGIDHRDEAMNHFGWLDLNDRGLGAKLFDYPDLFREAADSLYGEGLHEKALIFYEPLQHVDGFTDFSYFSDMAACYRAIGLLVEATECYRKLVEKTEINTNDRHQMMLICKELGIPDMVGSKIYKPGNPLTSAEHDRPKKVQTPRQSIETSIPDSSSFTMITSRLSRLATRTVVSDKVMNQKVKDENSTILFTRMQTLIKKARKGDFESRSEWMEIAKTMIQDFQSEKAIFTYDRQMRFFGYSKEARKFSASTKIEQRSRETEFMKGKFGFSIEQDSSHDEPIPNDFRAITFDMWLDMFLEYALILSLESDVKEGYKIISSALNANVFYHSPDFMFLIHVCWFTCALVAKDEETLCNVARWFMKEFQFVTDGYRLFSALNRLCDTSNSWYNCGPSQKYILRQLKAMDFSLIGKGRNQSLFQEKASYTTKDQNGNPIQATDLDIGLLILYGHILYVGRSYSYSINYFLRAFAVDPQNSMINLSLALAYIHNAIKRQADNRHHLIMQGFAFLFAYYNIRQGSKSALERQEADYNVARAYHMLGLTHLAVPYYQRCLEMDFEVQEADCEESFTREAAFSLQVIWAASGDAKKARDVTCGWLVL